MNNQLDQYRGKALLFTSEEEIVDNNTYKTLVSVININEGMFHKIWPNFYPTKGLSNQIGAAMGIEFTSNVIMEDVYGDIIENADGSKVKKTAGVRCVKQGKRRRPDGTWQLSSPCSYVFNWNDRAELDILADAEKEPNKQKYHFPNNPDKQRREQRKHILELKKFADQRASTGAELMVIRELTGMETSFKKEDIQKGQIVVSQIVESEELQRAKAKATIDNIRLGGQVAQNINDAAALLTGSVPKVEEGFDKKFDRPSEGAHAKHEMPEQKDVSTPDLNNNGELPLKDTFENLLNSDELKNHEGAYDFYLNTVRDNNYTDEVLNWAITEITKRIEGV